MAAIRGYYLESLVGSVDHCYRIEGLEEARGWRLVRRSGATEEIVSVSTAPVFQTGNCYVVYAREQCRGTAALRPVIIPVLDYGLFSQNESTDSDRADRLTSGP